jgi:AraC family transcriptional regulator of adaptative response/methylated-DNA-[protein]-cysteine methyltransferase
MTLALIPTVQNSSSDKERKRMKPTSEFHSESSRWQAVNQRDPQADGAFFYGVVTTGIYCRPTCASRLPNRENVRFFDGWQAAESAGFRPCKRCSPRQPRAADPAREIVLRACRLIEMAEKPPTLAQLAADVGLSPAYFHRLFKKWVGITPRQYAAEKRLDKARSGIQQETTIIEAIYNAGFESSSRFYEKATPALGMKPSEYKNGGKRLMIRFAISHAYLGWVLVAASEKGVCRIDFDDSQEALQQRLRDNFPQAELVSDDPEFAETVALVLAFLDQPKRGLDLPLDIQGTAFQRRVWAALQQIPVGITASYGDIAARIGQPKAARAVAQACGANHIAVAIPCHRVVRGNGELGGYRWGVDRKRAVLQRETDAPA